MRVLLRQAYLGVRQFNFKKDGMTYSCGILGVHNFKLETSMKCPEIE